MAPRAPSRSSHARHVVLLATILSAGCRVVTAAATAEPTLAAIDVSGIPATTVSATHPGLTLANGTYLLEGQPFDGFIEERYAGGQVRSLASYYRGLRHGETRTFHADGQPRDVRSYRANLSYGRHVGYWDNGNIKFDFTYVDDKREGLQRQWYRSGPPYTALTFRDDKERGMQQAWRENGRLYINYEARDGFRYGLQKSSLCYTLEDGDVK